MAKASRHNMGAGAKGKGAGVGAMTDAPEGMIEENMILSNRDKSQHTGERGYDSKRIQTEQMQDQPYERSEPSDEEIAR